MYNGSLTRKLAGLIGEQLELSECMPESLAEIGQILGGEVRLIGGHQLERVPREQLTEVHRSRCVQQRHLLQGIETSAQLLEVVVQEGQRYSAQVVNGDGVCSRRIKRLREQVLRRHVRPGVDQMCPVQQGVTVTYLCAHIDQRRNDPSLMQGEHQQEKGVEHQPRQGECLAARVKNTTMKGFRENDRKERWEQKPHLLMRCQRKKCNTTANNRHTNNTKFWTRNLSGSQGHTLQEPPISLRKQIRINELIQQRQSIITCLHRA
mmetsp:Transcript_51318/g.128782  ORF Transcript_51318/g.128782 Transcript_51318/m.128782 type:complete len:264 (-) Transcript_51318:1555-2346(-)